MDGKEIVQEWFGLTRQPQAEYLDLANQIDSAIAQAVAAKDAEIARLTATVKDLETERDGIKARSLAVIKGRDYDTLMLRDAVSVLTAERDALRAEVEQHVGTIEVLDAELRRAKALASHADGA
jgi:alkyl hydroperoxide reductase subunit AhpF